MKFMDIVGSRMLIRLSALFLMMLSLTSLTFAQSKKSDSFFGNGVDLYNNGQYQKAIACFEKVVELDKKDIPDDSPRAGYGKHWLANCYYKLGETSKAKEIYPYQYKYTPVDRRLTVESDKEDELSIQCQQKGQIEEAIQHAIKCLDLEKTNLGENSLLCVGSYLTLGNLYSQLGDNNSALQNYNSGFSILNTLGIENSIFNFHLIMGKVYVHLSNNDIYTALSEMKDLENIAEYAKRAENDEYPTALVDLLYARINMQNQDYAHSTTHVTNAFKSLLNQYDPNDDEKFSSIADCITTLFMISQYDVAESLLHEAIDKVTSNPGHKGILLSYLAESNGDIATYQESIELLSKSEYVDMYNSTKCLMANVYEQKGESLQAIAVYEDVCDYYSKNDSESPTYRKALMSLGDVYEGIGNYKNAYNCYKQVLDILKYNKKCPDFILTFMRWIPIYAKYSISSGRLDENNGFIEGYQMGSELKDIFANIRISDFLNEGIGLNTIANVALDFFQTFLQGAVMSPTISWYDIEKQLSQLTYDYLIPLNSENELITIRSKATLAHAKYLLGKYEESIALMNEIISTCKRYDYPYDNYLHDLAYYQYDSGDKVRAYDNFKIGYEFNKNNILSGYRWMTVEERDNLTRTHRGNLDNMPHYAAITPEDSRYAELGYNALLFTKGLLLNSTIELSRLLQEEGDASAINLLNQWRKKNQEYQNAMQKGDYIKAKSLKIQADVIERQLIDTSKAYGDYTEGLTVDFKEIQNGLNNGDIAIEFFSYQNDAKSRMYGAIMLTKNAVPKYIPVGLDKDWSKLIDNCYSDERLFNTLFEDLKPYFPGKDKGNIYFAADGLLHTIAIENLPGSEPYNFRRLSSTREIALRRGNSNPVSDIAVIGGVTYGIGKLAEYYKEDGSGKRESMDFLSYLPGTKIEADRVENIFAPKMNVSKFTADKATESNFKNFSGKRIGLLHLATHGFFNQPLNITNQAEHETEAMNSSGLYFAGAQNTLWGEPGRNMKEDGILTAQEISTLDLRGLRLAVLSACETGKGSIGPDGVFGLQRGFKQAGAEGLMMSLWKVDDKATQILMEEFYKNLSSGIDQYSALQKAQNIVKRDFPDPMYWAAFILIDAIRELKL